jgi:UDP-N-acetylglucosamine pyrophosphorylase
MWISASKQALQIAKRNLSNFGENSVISLRIEMLRRLNALSTPFYTPNLVHVDFIIETSAANRKQQSFKFRRKLCHFDPD